MSVILSGRVGLELCITFHTPFHSIVQTPPLVEIEPILSYDGHCDLRL